LIETRLLANPLFLLRNGPKARYIVDLLDTIPRARCKKLARDMQGCFAVHECLVEAVISVFCRKFWGDESGEGR
jgi:hypothetical protein